MNSHNPVSYTHLTVDAALELVDARIPLSSKNPDITRMLADKPRLILLNKSDLSSPQQNLSLIHI